MNAWINKKNECIHEWVKMYEWMNELTKQISKIKGNVWMNEWMNEWMSLLFNQHACMVINMYMYMFKTSVCKIKLSEQKLNNKIVWIILQFELVRVVKKNQLNII